MWPTISNIDDGISEKIKSYPNDLLKASHLNAWVRVFSGAKKGVYNGLIMESNTNWKLFNAAGEVGGTIYGSSQQSGTLGRDWGGQIVNTAEGGQVFRPSPIITSLTSKEGKDQISRTCEFSITCYSLEQLEYMQSFFMEPGYSIGVEWGWNTPESVLDLTKTGDVEQVLNGIADTTLNIDKLSSKRLGSKGEYDVFLGFIVGSSISNDGENFKIDVRLRGSPSLPTYLQSQNRIKKIKPKDSNGNANTIDTDKSKKGYGPSQITDTISAEKRRFGTMFNALPAFRQTESVKSLEDEANHLDYINFDPAISDKIDEYIKTSKWWQFWKGAGTIDVDGIVVEKEKLFSTNRYIRFGLAIDILSKVGDVEEYKLGNKSVSFKINIDNSIIGAFPNMFSTRASKLIIPGYHPDFSEYFLNPDEVQQYNDGKLNGRGVVFIPTFTTFIEQSELNSNELGLKERAKYYGYLKNLYVNFDMFCEKLKQDQKTIREILLDILNEMSSAVNGFWNFQIIESKFKKNQQLSREAEAILATTLVARPTEPQFNIGKRWNDINPTFTENGNQSIKSNTNKYLESGDVIITVVDENWIGEHPDPDNIKKFRHSGIDSPFLSSTLDVSIPSEMANQIILKRMGYDSQKDMSDISVDTTSLFNTDTDLFMTRVVSGSEIPRNETPTDETKNADEIKRDQYEAEEAKIDYTKTKRDSVDLGMGISTTTEYYYDSNNNLIKTEIRKVGIGKSNTIKYENINLTAADIKIIKGDIASDKSGRLSAFLDKIDVVPNPTYANPEDFNISDKIKEIIGKNLVIYCYDDTDFFEMMKNYYFIQKYKNEKKSGLSHPLPIKYTFTILGNSGIRRGDTFNIDGIPQKYSDSGLFQVTDIEHSLSDMKWTTTVTGQYRQTQ
jgi:hypothetical protein